MSINGFLAGDIEKNKRQDLLKNEKSLLFLVFKNGIFSLIFFDFSEHFFKLYFDEFLNKISKNHVFSAFSITVVKNPSFSSKSELSRGSFNVKLLKN